MWYKLHAARGFIILNEHGQKNRDIVMHVEEVRGMKYCLKLLKTIQMKIIKKTMNIFWLNVVGERKRNV